MKQVLYALAVAAAVSGVSYAGPDVQAEKVTEHGKSVPAYLQDISVTIRAGGSEGSGVITNVDGISYVWTAAHVVARLREERQVIDPASGSTKTVIEFQDAEVIKELIEDGRTVGQTRFFAEVIRYSNADTGDDLALLRVRKKKLVDKTVKFYLDEEIPPLGTELYHVGSLLGQQGSNSLTTGIYSQHGRLINGTVYDQTTCAAFPGSSGGGVYMRDGRYVGMIVRGAGETFNLVVPVRRIHAWAKKMGVDFILNPKVKAPTTEDLRKCPIEDVARNQGQRADAKPGCAGGKFLIRVTDEMKVAD